MIRLLVITMIAASTTLANARSLHVPDSTQAYTLDQVTLAKNSYVLPNAKLATNATIDIDVKEQEMKLTVYYRPSNLCPKGAMCFAGPIQTPPVVIILPLTDSKQDNCSVIKIVAQKDRRNSDGGLVRVEIADHTNDTCSPQVMERTTNVRVTEIAARSNKAIVSKLSGKQSQNPQ